MPVMSERSTFSKIRKQDIAVKSCLRLINVYKENAHLPEGEELNKFMEYHLRKMLLNIMDNNDNDEQYKNIAEIFTTAYLSKDSRLPSYFINAYKKIA